MIFKSKYVKDLEVKVEKLEKAAESHDRVETYAKDLLKELEREKDYHRDTRDESYKAERKVEELECEITDTFDAEKKDLWRSVALHLIRYKDDITDTEVIEFTNNIVDGLDNKFTQPQHQMPCS